MAYRVEGQLIVRLVRHHIAGGISVRNAPRQDSFMKPHEGIVDVTISYPQLNPHPLLSRTTSAYHGSPRGVVSH